MKLINGFKLLYEKGVGEERKIYASKENVPTTEDNIIDPNIGSYPDAKLFYQKDDELFVSDSNVPTVDDEAFTVTSDGAQVMGTVDTPVEDKPTPEEPEVETKEVPVKTSTRGRKSTPKVEEEVVEPKAEVE